MTIANCGTNFLKHFETILERQEKKRSDRQEREREIRQTDKKKIIEGESVPPYIKGGNNIMYTFTIVVHIAKVYIILLPPFITKKMKVLISLYRGIIMPYHHIK